MGYRLLTGINMDITQEESLRLPISLTTTKPDRKQWIQLLTPYYPGEYTAGLVPHIVKMLRNKEFMANQLIGYVTPAFTNKSRRAIEVWALKSSIKGPLRYEQQD